MRRARPGDARLLEDDASDRDARAPRQSYGRTSRAATGSRSIPGIYDMRAMKKVGMTKLPKPHAVHVRRGHWDRINLFFDTGMR